jgi:hypothetical protein
MLQMFVAFPDDVKIGIAAVVLWAVSFFFVKLIALIPFLKFLEEFRQPLTLAATAALVGWLENIVPDAFSTVAILGVQLVLALLAVFGVGETLKKRGYRAFQ